MIVSLTWRIKSLWIVCNSLNRAHFDYYSVSVLNLVQLDRKEYCSETWLLTRTVIDKPILAFDARNSYGLGIMVWLPR